MANTPPQLVILGWHNVEASWHFPKSRLLATRGLAAQLALLRQLASVVPLEGAFARLLRGEPLPRRAVALTFDDGYADTVRVIAPMLLRHRLPATFFLCPGLLSRSDPPAWEVVSWAVRMARANSLDWRGRDYPLQSERARRTLARRITDDLKGTDTARRQTAVASLVKACRPSGALGLDEMLLDWSGAARLVQLGFAIGSHTMSHPILSRESRSVQHREIFCAREQLGRRLGIEPATFAYPNGARGDFTDQTTRILRESGHQLAVTTMPGFNDASADPFTAGRIIVNPEQGPAAFLQLFRGVNGARPTDEPGDEARTCGFSM